MSVAEYINAADVFVLGSHTEGWSTSLVEALACGKPIVTTDVSSANDIVRNGVTGYIVKDRNPEDFNSYIDQALNLKNVHSISETIAKRYSKATLRNDLVSSWDNLREVLQ
jgi:glycosyltransferase involved in cell wall biosynthesis